MAASHAQGTTRFVGRQHELRVLGEILTEVAAGGSAAVSVVGEPGIGKTRLATELACGS